MLLYSLYFANVTMRFEWIKNLARKLIPRNSISDQTTPDARMQASEPTIRELQELSRTPLLMVHHRQRKKSSFKCFSLGRNAKAEMSAGDHRIMPIGSVTKIFINFAFFRIMRDGGFKDFRNFTFQTKACELFNHLTDRRNQRSKQQSPHISILEGDPRIGQLFCHINGAPPMYERLLGPEGTCYMSKDEFIEHLPHMTKQFRQQLSSSDPHMEYSNSNHVFLALILELGMDTEIGKILKEWVFEPMRMKHTFVGECPEELKPLCIKGHMIGSTSIRPISGPTTTDVVESAVLGAWSSAADVDQFFHTLMEIYNGDCNIAEFDKLKSAMGTFFTIISPDPGKAPVDAYYTPYGLVDSLPSVEISKESLNGNLIPDSTKGPVYQLGKYGKKKRKRCLFSKAGYVDGFSVQVCVEFRSHIVTVVMGNAASPLTVTGFVAHEILQNSLSLSPRVEFIDHAQKVFKHTIRTIKKLENEEGTSPSFGPVNPKLFGACFEESVSGLQISIYNAEEVYMGASKRTRRLGIKQISEKKIQLVPGECGFGIERWGAWKDLAFTIEGDKTSVWALVGSNDCRYNYAGSATPS